MWLTYGNCILRYSITNTWYRASRNLPKRSVYHLKICNFEICCENFGHTINHGSVFSSFVIAVSPGIQNPGSLCDGFSDKAVQAPGKISFVVFEMSFMVTDLKTPKESNSVYFEFRIRPDSLHFV